MTGFENQHHNLNVSDSFDHDYGTSHDLSHHGSHQIVSNDHMQHLVTTGSSYDQGNEIFHYQDPLKYSAQHQFQPLHLDLGVTHFVKPHEVNGYVRSDGTAVKGYYRDGGGPQLKFKVVKSEQIDQQQAPL